LITARNEQDLWENYSIFVPLAESFMQILRRFVEVSDQGIYSQERMFHKTEKICPWARRPNYKEVKLLFS